MKLQYRTLPTVERDDLWAQRIGERKWAPVIRDLMMGEHVFVADMSRGQLETLRSILRDKGIISLRSKTVIVDGAEGKLLRLR